LAVVGVGAGSALEESNSFCNACHVHATTYKDFTTRQPWTLAGAHHGEEVRCIDCHREPGLTGRVTTLASGAVNLVRYATGSYHTPIKTDEPPSNAACGKCHSATSAGEQQLRGHFHTFLARANSDRLQKPILCANCHSAHSRKAGEHGVVVTAAQSACKSCHVAYGEGPTRFKRVAGAAGGDAETGEGRR